MLNRSAITGGDDTYDLVFTDPPYYDAIPYSDLMDFSIFGYVAALRIWARIQTTSKTPCHLSGMKKRVTVN